MVSVSNWILPFGYTLRFSEGEATAAYLYFIIAQGADMSSPMVSAILNDQSVGSWLYEGNPNVTSVSYAYNVLMYGNESLVPPINGSQSMHNLTIVSFGGALFDYAMYTYVPDVVRQVF